MKNSLKFCVIITAFVLTASNPMAWSQVCGDMDGDGTVNVGDAIYIMNYLVTSGPPPVDFEMADIDHYKDLTFSDAAAGIGIAFYCDTFFPECPPPWPPLDPEIDSGTHIRYPNRIPGGVTAGELALTVDFSYPYRGMMLPFKLRIDGQIPTIDSVAFPAESSGLSFGYQAIDHDSGIIILAGIAINHLGYSDKSAKIYVSLPSSPFEKSVTLDWVILSPQQAPTPDSTIYPLVTYECGGGKEPVLSPHCCYKAGDTNGDGSTNVADAVCLISYIFPPFGCEPKCLIEGDANCDCGFNIGDAVYLINYIFKGGPPPECCCM